MSKTAIREQIFRSGDEPVACRVVKGEGYVTPWHFHPELELTLVLKSRGHRIVGDNITTLHAGDLVLVGANLPHVWYQERGAGNVHAIVVQFAAEFVGSELLERTDFQPVKRLFERARRGLHVTGTTRDFVAERMRGLPEATQLRRVAELLAILEALTRCDKLKPLCSEGYARPVNLDDQDRMNRVTRFIHDHLAEPLTRDEAARIAALSLSAFSRFFKARTGRTFPAYLNELRLGRAARLLAETDHRIAEIAQECGFPNLSNFNRLFLSGKGMTPRQWRARLV